ncbi:MAG: phosphatase PAP2 family protein [Dehalococcoidia bacterium]|nr:phosphatase PAP2 family protein [Dehalococcoidia bacterium]MDD5495085.1 phosphatase PAP2 family protein [Dehalococcoidia bacterium]
MEAIWQWGLSVIIFVQQMHSPVMDSIFRGITFMGEEQFYLFLLPFFVWCLDYSFGAVLAAFFLLSNYINICLKDLLMQPRPFDINPSVKLGSVEGYGMPSGHAQSAVVVWGAVALWVRRKWFWALAIVIILLISFSRVYLGLHFPTDVFAGWVTGAILLLIYIAIGDRVQVWLKKLNLALQLLLALGVPVLLVLLHPTNDAGTTLGTLAGMSAGLVVTQRYVSFSARGLWWKRIVRFVCGLIVLLALYIGLKAAFPGEGSPLQLFFRFLRYGLLGIWVTLGAPWLFRLTRLASTAE